VAQNCQIVTSDRRWFPCVERFPHGCASNTSCSPPAPRTQAFALPGALSCGAFWLASSRFGCTLQSVPATATDRRPRSVPERSFGFGLFDHFGLAASPESLSSPHPGDWPLGRIGGGLTGNADRCAIIPRANRLSVVPPGCHNRDSARVRVLLPSRAFAFRPTRLHVCLLAWGSSRRAERGAAVDAPEAPHSGPISVIARYSVTQLQLPLGFPTSGFADHPHSRV
jgi:hypothetical protein